MKSNQIYSGIVLFIKSIGIVLIFFIGIILYFGISYSYNYKKIPLVIKSDFSVLNAEILFDSGVFKCEFFIKILFKDGCSMIVDRVNEFGNGNKMEIRRVNNMEISIVNKKNDVAIEQEQQLKFFSALTGTQLETIMDIVKNYRVICSEIENWVNLSDYEQDNEDIRQLRERVFLENLFPESIITFDGQEYFLYKWNPKLSS
jgi:hypothetical protein